MVIIYSLNFQNAFERRKRFFHDADGCDIRGEYQIDVVPFFLNDCPPCLLFFSCLNSLARFCGYLLDFDESGCDIL